MHNAKAQKSKPIFLFMRIAVVVCGVIWGIYWVSREQRWDKLTGIFSQMNMWVFACALGVFVIGQMLIGLRWWLLLRTQSIFISLWAAIKLYFLGWFYNNFMPSSVGGDLIRAWYVTRHTDKKLEAVLSVFIDRVVIGLLGTLSIAVFCYLFFFRDQLSAITFSGQDSLFRSIAEYKWLFLCVVVVIVVVFCGFLLHRRGRLMLRKSWSYICVHGAKIFEKLKNTTVIYCRKPLTILAVWGLTVFLQLLTITGFWFLGRNLGVNASIKYYYLIFALTWVLGAVPVSIGGAVVIESLLAYFFILFAGVEAEPALALALCQRAVWMLASLPGAAIHLMGAHLPKDFFIDYNKSIN